MIDSENTQEENINITLSVPIEQLRGIAPINYTKLSEMVLEQISISDLASDVKDNFDMSDLAESVAKELDMDSLAKEVKDNIDMEDFASDVKDYFDMDDIANDVSNLIKDDSTSFDEKLNDLMEDYNPINSCETGKRATKVVINAIRYDIMCHLYGQDESKLDVTITDVLRKFIKQELASIEEAKTTFTIGEIIDVLTGINSVNHKITEIVVAFSKAKPPAMKTLGEVKIKAD